MRRMRSRVCQRMIRDDERVELTQYSHRGSRGTTTHARLDTCQRQTVSVRQTHAIELLPDVRGRLLLPKPGFRMAHDVVADGSNLGRAPVDLGAHARLELALRRSHGSCSLRWNGRSARPARWI